MAYEDSHVSEQDLLLAADGELPSRRTAEIQDHLAACWACRTRMKEIDSAIAGFIHWYRQLDPGLPPADGPRALLKARLAELALEPRRRYWFGRLRLAITSRRLVYISSAIFVLVSIGMISHRVIAHLNNLPGESAHLFSPPGDLLLPDRRLTPGATVRLSVEELCSAGNVDAIHRIPASLARETFEAYGISRPQPRMYEVDYLITPALGGADDIRNLWPQRYTAGVWNSRHKDALEHHLQQLVCAKKLSLAVAQHDISTNWISAYKKYFKTKGPMPEHLAFVKDQAWEE